MGTSVQEMRSEFYADQARHCHDVEATAVTAAAGSCRRFDGIAVS
jgi:hypothetical protein